MLNVALPMTTAYCRYTIVNGSGTGTTNPVLSNPAATFLFTSPPGVWYYMLAECDMDGDGEYASFFTSSVDSTIQKANEGE
jgi:hypothetical protein